MLIHELSEKVGLHPDTIRRAERKGLIHSRRDINGWRHFEESAVHELMKLYVAVLEDPAREGEG